MIIFFLLFAKQSFADSEPSKLFIMLETNNVLYSKISAANSIEASEYSKELVKQGYTVQPYEYTLTKDDGAVYNFYKNQTSPRDLVYQDDNGNLRITQMIAIRPAMKNFLEELLKLKMPTYFLICSINSDKKTKNISELLELNLNNKPFTEVSNFVPKNLFKVNINSSNGVRYIAKSAWSLRKNYIGKFGRIKENDYVVLIDQLSDRQFIYSNIKKDLNIIIKPFTLKKNETFNLEQDKKDLDIILNQIKGFISDKK